YQIDSLFKFIINQSMAINQDLDEEGVPQFVWSILSVALQVGKKDITDKCARLIDEILFLIFFAMTSSMHHNFVSHSSRNSASCRKLTASFAASIGLKQNA